MSLTKEINYLDLHQFIIDDNGDKLKPFALIKKLCELNDVSIDDLIKQLNVTRPVFRNNLNTYTIPDDRSVLICKFFNLNLNQFIDYIDEFKRG